MRTRMHWILVSIFGLAHIASEVTFLAPRLSSLPFSDQWDFMRGLWNHVSLWELWSWQHGPHRLGLGLLLPRLYLGLSHLNLRADAWVALGLYAASTILMLRLLQKLSLANIWSSLTVIAFGLSPLFYESIVGPTDLAHGPLPMLLALLSAYFVINNEGTPARVLIASILVFCCLFTGFAMFIIVPIGLIMTLHLLRKKKLVLFALFAALSLGSVFAFIHGYRSQPAVACFHFPDPRPWEYRNYDKLHYGALTGLQGKSIVIIGIGFVILTALIVDSIKARHATTAAERVSLVLILSSLAFIANAAIGRVCVGSSAGQVSRYMPYAVLGIWGLIANPRRIQKPKRMLAFMTVVAVMSLFFGSHRAIRESNALASGRLYWEGCLAKGSTPEACAANAPLEPTGRFMIYPDISSLTFRESLESLKDQHLSTFHD